MVRQPPSPSQTISPGQLPPMKTWTTPHQKLKLYQREIVQVGKHLGNVQGGGSCMGDIAQVGILQEPNYGRVMSQGVAWVSSNDLASPTLAHLLMMEHFAKFTGCWDKQNLVKPYVNIIHSMYYEIYPGSNITFASMPNIHICKGISGFLIALSCVQVTHYSICKDIYQQL